MSIKDRVEIVTLDELAKECSRESDQNHKHEEGKGGSRGKKKW